MKYTIKFIYLIIIYILSLLTSSSLFAAESSERTTLRETLQQLWDSLESLEIHAVSDTLDSTGVPDGKLHFVYETLIGSGDRSALKISVGKDGNTPRVMHDFRCDGKRRIDVMPLPNDDKTPDIISISALQQPDVLFDGPMNEILWLLVPDGRPLYVYVNDKSKIEFNIDQKNKKSISLSCDLPRGRLLRCELDPAQDYLPRRVELQSHGQLNTYEVTRYTQDNGRWFPAEGNKVSRNDQSIKRQGFKVLKVKWNRGIPDSAFSVPNRLEAGMIIRDNTIKHGSRVIGGHRARNAFLRKHNVSFTNQEAPDSTELPIRAPQTNMQYPFAKMIGLASLIILTVAIFLRILRR